MNAFGLVIFDCDGVLVDSERIAQRVLSAALTENGVPTTPDDCVETYMGRSRQDCIAIIESKIGGPAPRALLELDDALFDAFRRELRPIPGVQAALEALAVPTCVASSGHHERIQLTLSLTGLLTFFEGRCFSATEVQRGKPHPDLFLHAADALGIDPGNCAVVEDSVHGTEAGVAAGMTVFGYSDLTPANRLRDSGAHVFVGMDELPGLIANGRRHP